MRISDLLAGGDDGVPGEPVVAAEVAAPPPAGSELLAAGTVPDLIEDAELVEEPEPVGPPPVAPTDPTDDLLPRRG